jgi:hypothetical protein
MVPLRFEIEPTTDPSKNEVRLATRGSSLFREGGRNNPEIWQEKSAVPIGGGISAIGSIPALGVRAGLKGFRRLLRALSAVEIFRSLAFAFLRFCDFWIFDFLIFDFCEKIIFAGRSIVPRNIPHTTCAYQPVTGQVSCRR